MFYFAIGLINYLKHINAKALSLAQILKTVQEKELFIGYVLPFCIIRLYALRHKNFTNCIFTLVL